MTSQPTARELDRDFRLLLGGQVFSWLGNGFQPVALAVAVITTGGSPSQLGVVLASSMLGRVVFSLIGGVWADRLQPRTLMIVSDLIRMVTVGAMALMFGTGHRWIWLLCILAFITAAANAFFMPSMTALKPMVVRPERLRMANAQLSLFQRICQVVSPAAGGLVVAAWGAQAGFSVNAGSFLVSALSLVFIRARVVRQERTGMLTELKEGWVEVRSRDWLFLGLIGTSVYHVANGMGAVLGPVIALDALGGAHAVGFIAAAEGAGGVLGAALALRIRPHRPLLWGWSLLPLMGLTFAAYVVPGALVGVCVAAVIGYAALIFFDIGWETTITEQVPHERLARVESWDTLGSFIGYPLGNAIAGGMASAFGTNNVMIGIAIVIVLSSLFPLLAKGSRTTRSQHATSVSSQAVVE